MATSSGFNMMMLAYLISLAACAGGTHQLAAHVSDLAVKPPAPVPPSPRPSPPTLNLFSPPPTPFPPPSGTVVDIHNEGDLAQAIAAATGSRTTTLRMPALLYLTKALPDVTGNLMLINANGTAVVTCSASGFVALRVMASTFDMTGITWTSCTSVMDISSASQVTIDGSSFLNGGSGMTQVRVTDSCSESYTHNLIPCH